MVPIFIILISFFFNILISRNKTNVYNKVDFFKILLKFKSPKKRFSLYYRQFRFYFNFTIAFIIISLIIMICDWDDMARQLTLLGMILLGQFSIIIYFENRIARKREKSNIGNYDFTLLFTYIFMGLLMLTLSSNLKVISVKDRKSTYGTKIYLPNKVILSDSLNYFIGKTEDYFFIYHENDKYTEVYNMADVKKIVYKNK